MIIHDNPEFIQADKLQNNSPMLITQEQLRSKCLITRAVTAARKKNKQGDIKIAHVQLDLLLTTVSVNV